MKSWSKCENILAQIKNNDVEQYCCESLVVDMEKNRKRNRRNLTMISIVFAVRANRETLMIQFWQYASLSPLHADLGTSVNVWMLMVNAATCSNSNLYEREMLLHCVCLSNLGGWKRQRCGYLYTFVCCSEPLWTYFVNKISMFCIYRKKNGFRLWWTVKWDGERKRASWPHCLRCFHWIKIVLWRPAVV